MVTAVAAARSRALLLAVLLAVALPGFQLPSPARADGPASLPAASASQTLTATIEILAGPVGVSASALEFEGAGVPGAGTAIPRAPWLAANATGAAAGWSVTFSAAMPRGASLRVRLPQAALTAAEGEAPRSLLPAFVTFEPRRTEKAFALAPGPGTAGVAYRPEFAIEVGTASTPVVVVVTVVSGP